MSVQAALRFSEFMLRGGIRMMQRLIAGLFITLFVASATAAQQGTT
jgi:hypothetical protein